MKAYNEYRIELKWALIFSAMSLLWMALEKITGLHDVHINLHPVITNLVAIPAILVYVLALRDKKKNFYAGQMNYLQGLISGLIMTAIVTILSPLMLYIVFTFISPGFFEQIISYSLSHQLMPEQAARNYFNLRNYIQQALIGTPFMGLLTTAIVVYFIRTRP